MRNIFIALSVIISVFLLFLSTNCGKNNSTEIGKPASLLGSESDVDSIKSIINDVMKVINEGDVEHFKSLLAEDVVWIPPHAPALTGKKWINSLYHFDSTTYNLNIAIEDIQVCGECAFSREAWALSTTKEGSGMTLHENFNSLTILRRQDDGSWKIWYKISNEK